MDQILNNLSDPAWWFTGTFFVLFGVLLTRLIFNWVPSAWKTFIGLKPKFARKVYRWKERRVLLQITGGIHRVPAAVGQDQRDRGAVGTYRRERLHQR